MNVSAQARYLDYAVRPLHAKSKRRSNDDTSSRRKVDPRPDEAQADDAEPRVPVLVLDEDDDGVEYSRHVPSRGATTARKDMIAETVRPTSLQNTATLLTLITAGDGRQRGIDPAAKPSPSRGDAFYDLLDQVIAQA